MYYHLRQMKNPISQAYISTLFQSIFHTKIKKNESFDSFGKQRRIIFRSCKEAGFPEDKAYLICCYIRSLDSNYDNIRELLDTNALDWFNKTLDEVIQLTTDIKLNKTTTGSQVSVTGTGNAVGKQGAVRPSSTNTSFITTTTQAPNTKDFLTKPSDLTGTEVAALIGMYSCPLCRKNSHPVWRCYYLRNTNDIKLKHSNIQSPIPRATLPAQLSVTNQPPTVSPTSTPLTSGNTNRETALSQ